MIRGRAICCLVALSCTCAAGVNAQSQTRLSTQSTGPSASNSDESIMVGPFLFSPTIQLSWQDRDNIFFTPDNEVADQVYQAGATLLFEVPINQSFIHFSYSPLYTDYKTYDLEDKWSHFFDVGGTFTFSNGLVLDATYNYIIGNLQTRLVDGGGELYYGDPNFVKQFAAVGVQYWFTPRDGAFVEAGWTDLDNSDPTLFYDYTRVGAGLGWIHQVGPNTTMDVRYGRSEFDAHDTEFTSNGFRDSVSSDVTVGVKGQLSPVVGTEIRVGYMLITYDLQPGDPDVSDFKGFIVNGFFDWSLGHGSVVRLELLRSPYPSNYEDNANYVATGGALQYTLDRGSIYGSLSGGFQNNGYELPDPRTGEKRSDDILTLGLGMGYRFTHYFSLWGSYVYEDRASLYQYSYTTNIFTLGLVLGF